jgi:hypothetical protein
MPADQHVDGVQSGDIAAGDLGLQVVERPVWAGSNESLKSIADMQHCMPADRGVVQAEL